MSTFKKALFTSTALFIVILAYFAMTQGKPASSLPILGTVPQFVLYDTTTKEFSLENLKGRTWVADFIFTTCGGICPVMSRNMASIYRSFVSIKDLHFVSFSVNPEYDSPEVLSEYAKRFHGDPARWHFLTGARNEISKLATTGFKIGSVDDPIMHSGYFVLVDKSARIRGYYDGTKEETIRKLLTDIAKLLKE